MRTPLVVIGAGTAGLRTALTAASSGTETVLIGTGPVAGTCLNTGCIPTKAMLHAADVFRTCSEAGEIGITATAKVDFAKVMGRVRGIITEGRTHAESSVKHHAHLTYIEGRARFVSPAVIEVGNHRISAEKVIIATGTRPGIPPVPGLEKVPYITNEEAVRLTEQPKHLLIVGGGYIACEYATFFASIGTKVTILERAPDILTVLDEDLRKVIRASLDAMGVRILTGVATTNVSHAAGKFTCTLQGADVSRVQGDTLLVAAGRTPNTADLGLERAGIDVDGRGFIPVDQYLRTSQRHVYAIGDVNGQALFAHAAKREGWRALEHALLGKRPRAPRHVPWAVFTHPPAAGIGLSEQELKKQGTRYDVLEARFSSCGKARIIRCEHGLVKILHKHGHILGAFIVGPDADNLIHEFCALMLLGERAIAGLQELIHIHPTLAEVHENLRSRH